jgi:hypothetical protein
LIATLVLLGMVVLVRITNSARDEALQAERHAYDVTLLTRTWTPASRGRGARRPLSRSTRGRRTSGSRYYASGAWRTAADPARDARFAAIPTSAAAKNFAAIPQRGQQFSDVARYMRGRQKAMACAIITHLR